MKMKRNRWTLPGLALAVLVAAAGTVSAAPETRTISGTVIDLSCATKGMAMMGSNYNAENNTHKTPNGEMASCATMCLKGGQPAALYDKGEIKAVFLANPSFTLYKFAQKNVDVQGFWGGSGEVPTFFPEKIREAGTSEWTDVQAAEMH